MSEEIIIDVIVDETFDIETTSTVVDLDVPNPVLSVITVEGPIGPVGPAGDGGLTHTQTAPAATWTIIHSLGRRPASVSVWLDDELVDTTIETPDASTVVVTFAAPQSGRAEII